MSVDDFLITGAVSVAVVGFILCQEWLERRKRALQRWRRDCIERECIQAGEDAAS